MDPVDSYPVLDEMPGCVKMGAGVGSHYDLGEVDAFPLQRGVAFERGRRVAGVDRHPIVEPVGQVGGFLEDVHGDECLNMTQGY